MTRVLLRRWCSCCLPAILITPSALGCGPRLEEPQRDEPPSTQILDGGQPVPYDGGSDEPPPLPPATLEAPEGWHRWPFPPEDCAIFVPDDLATVVPPPWEPCPFMPDGCTRATAPWAAETSWGYGNHLRLAVVNGRAYIGVGRPITKTETGWWWETLLLRDNTVLGAWRYGPTEGQCGLIAPWIQRDGRASIVAKRHQAHSAPHIYLSAPETLMTAPERTEVFGPPNAHVGGGSPAQRSDKLLVVREGAHRFGVRDLLSGATYRPTPPEPYPMVGTNNAVPIGGAVVYNAWDSFNASVWVFRPYLGSVPLLLSPDYSYDFFVTDGVDAAWTRAYGLIGPTQYETVELWTSPVATTPEGLQPKLLATLPESAIVMLSIGEGWIGAYTNPELIRLYRISDGLVRELPKVDGLLWTARGQYEGLVIAGGAVWVKTALADGPGNDMRFITRFEIDKLPPPP